MWEGVQHVHANPYNHEKYQRVAHNETEHDYHCACVSHMTHVMVHAAFVGVS